MSFEDDAYWESEYTDRSAAARYPASREPAAPLDELSVRRRRRQGRYRRPARRDGGVQKGFDTERPGWLDDPDFVPTDVSGPDVAADSAVLDFNRPELGGSDLPGRPWTGRDAARVDDDWDDEIDEPYDHRTGMDRRSTVPRLDGHVPPPEDWDGPSPEDWDDLDEPSAGLDGPYDLYRRGPEERRGAWPEDMANDRDRPRALGTAPVSPAAIGIAPVSPTAAVATIPVPTRPAPPAGVPAPVQRAPADAAMPPPDLPAETRPDTPPRRDADAGEAAGWFGTTPRRPAASGTTVPDTNRDDGPALPDPAIQPAPTLAPEDLQAVRWRLDGATLREVVDDQDALRDVGSRLDGPLAEETDHVSRAGLLSLRAEVYRLLGELGMAAAASRLALAHAESARDVHAIVIAQAELAHVLRLRGHYLEADRLLEEAAGSEAPERLRSVIHEYAGRSCFDQGRHMEALDHFTRAIRLGAPDDLDLVERVDVCLEAVYIHVLRDGWGPYPRMRREILGTAR